MSQTTAREYRGRRESVNVEGGKLKEVELGMLEVRVDIDKKKKTVVNIKILYGAGALFNSNVLNQVIHGSGTMSTG